MKEALANLFRCVQEMMEAQSVEQRARRDYEHNKNGETLLGWHKAQKALDKAKESYNAAAATCDGLAE